jgi:predicted TIM-barrel fold metal-dependent hydrolase
VVEELGSGEMLMYSSDYPHLHAEAPEEILDQLPVATAEGIRHGNARAFYRLGGG